MAEDPEKKFHSIMDKLFCSGVSSSSKGKKRLHPRSTSGLVDIRVDSREASAAASGILSSSAPLCRPWDRGDLMKRLATFKSVTWFAKPKVVSAVNCARRGWVNVDNDTIACESCGAHMLFTTPTSWNRQQVEKAALVFSLKLDNGHKFHCPWIDNTCDERLTDYPPTSLQDLAEKYHERVSALLQLSYLPVTSTLSCSNLENSDLREFLRGFLGLQEGFSSAVHGGEHDAVSAKLYNQAKKLISLCGWELRTLSYAVDFKDKSKHRIQDTGISILPDGISGCHNSNLGDDPVWKYTRLDASKDLGHSGRLAVDPNSVVLECRFCGATVGLWTFSLVPQPLEVLRLMGSVEVDSRDNIEQETGNNVKGFGGSSASDRIKAETSSLSCTIAGGPPPRIQNFKATISVPVIGQNLRARINYETPFRDSNNLEVHQGTLPELKSYRDAEICEPSTRDFVEMNDKLEVRNSNNQSSLNAEKNTNGEEQNSDSVEPLQPVASSELSDTVALVLVSDAIDTSNNSAKEQRNCQEVDSVHLKFHKEGEHLSSNDTGLVSRKDEVCCDVASNVTSNEDSVHTSKEASQSRPNAEIGSSNAGNEEYVMFDPIQQHRHFCPWIVSTKSAAAGWQQTLSALRRQKNHCDPSVSKPMLSSSLIQVDDPISSVRKLFKSPLEKRLKQSHSSSGADAQS